MPKILELDRHVADLIAAGEVVERPASAAKELMENAVDAGATQVTVEIQNGGMTYLRVTDNGCGIAPEDVETAFLRHATSKLRTKEDLAAIGTLGFRGEALAAIASVSKIDLLTKTAEAEGVSLRLEAGKVVERSPAGCPEGTTIVVRELFYNTPARLKFMKRDTVEASQVAGAVQRQALAHPDVAFRFLKDGEMVLKTAGNGDLYGAVYQVFGRQLAVDMIPVESSFEGLKLSGFVTKPTATRGNRSMQQFFVNGRPVRAKLLTAALEEAYANQMMSGRYPSCVLVITLPNAAVDVNVHPAKTEVKFANERAVFDLVRYGVMSALGRAQQRPEMKLAKPMAEKPKPSEVRSALEALHTSAPVSPQVRSAFSQPQFRQPVASPAPGRGSVPVYLPKRPAPVKQAPMEEKRPTPPVQEKQPVQEKLPEPQEEAQTALDMPAAAPYRVVGEVLDTYFILETRCSFWTSMQPTSGFSLKSSVPPRSRYCLRCCSRPTRPTSPGRRRPRCSSTGNCSGTTATRWTTLATARCSCGRSRRIFPRTRPRRCWRPWRRSLRKGTPGIPSPFGTSCSTPSPARPPSRAAGTRIPRSGTRSSGRS